VCTLATMYWTFWKGAAIMAMVYPLFILVACKSEPLRAYQRGARPALASPLSTRHGLHPLQVSPETWAM
jgi:hypothetical protein